MSATPSVPTRALQPRRPRKKYGRRRRFRWSWVEEQYLRTHWGTLSVQVIARKLGRCEGSVAARARKLRLKARHGIVKLHVLATRSGYYISRILGAVAHLGLKVIHVPRLDPRQQRTPKHKGLDEEDAQRVLDYLATLPDGQPLMREDGQRAPRDVWGVGERPPACLGHLDSDAPHYAEGYCRRCYERRRSRRRRGQPVDDAAPPVARTTRAHEETPKPKAGSSRKPTQGAARKPRTSERRPCARAADQPARVRVVPRKR